MYGLSCGKLVRSYQFAMDPDNGNLMDVQHQYVYGGIGGRLRYHVFNSNFLQTDRYVWEYEYNNLGMVNRIFYPVQVANSFNLTSGAEIFDNYLKYDYAFGLPTSAFYCRCYDTDGSGNLLWCPVDRLDFNCQAANHHKQDIVWDRNYHAGGLPHRTRLGNGTEMLLKTNQTTKMNRPERILAGFGNQIAASATNYWDSGLYSYDGVGNIMGMNGEFINGQGQTKAFQYDLLSRIERAELDVAGTSQGDQTRLFGYDAFGNMTQNGPHNLFIESATNRLAKTFTDSKGIQFDYADYDYAGNLTAFGRHGYVFDRAGRMIRYEHVGDDAVTVDGRAEFWYDVDGERIGKCRRVTSADPSGTLEEFTFYLRDESGSILNGFSVNACPAPQYSGQGIDPALFKLKKSFVYFGGQLAASESIDGIGGPCPDWYYYHPDHLGNPRVITNETGSALSFHDYWPFGEEITAQGQDDLTHKYTGHEGLRIQPRLHARAVLQQLFGKVFEPR